MARDPIVWLDLEMTGLDPAQHRIIEMATLVTDSALNVVAEGPELIVHQPEAVLDGMNDWSREQHARSGLVDRVRASPVSEEEAQERTLSFLRGITPPGVAPLGGSSVHLDRYFLEAQMPSLAAHLAPGNIDVSTLKELARRWAPAVLAAAPVKSDTHRALEDIRESVRELRHYRDHFMVAPVP